MEEDWDLHAVVRGCSTMTSPSSTTTTTPTSTTSTSSGSSSGFGSFYLQPEASSGFSIFDGEQTSQVLSLSSYPFEERSSIEELHELCKPFFTKSQPSPLSSFSYSSVSPKLVPTQEKQQQRSKQPSVTTPRSKRRKNQLKRVCQVPVENLSSDIWAWRKYGQKPIKGSPYPRGYYRCSSSKGCLARKQVERDRSDPTMFIVTYTGEHNHPAPSHRNSLAGSTRQKPLTPPQTATNEDSEKAMTKPSSPATTSGAEEEVSPKVEKSEKEDVMDEEEEDEFGVSDMVFSDDFFDSLDELSQITGPSAATTGDCFNDPFSALALPAWVTNNSAATAASGS